MVWKPTKRFGIGKATSHEDGMFCTYIVALYAEKGNNRDEYASNVLKGDFDFGYCDSMGKQHRQTFRRYQRERVETFSTGISLSRKNSKTPPTEYALDKKNVKSAITEKLKLEKSFFPKNNETNDIRKAKKNFTSSYVSVRTRNNTKDATEMTEDVLRPKDIVLSIKKIDTPVLNANKKSVNQHHNSTPVTNVNSNDRSGIDKKTNGVKNLAVSFPTTATQKPLKKETNKVGNKAKLNNLRKGKKLLVDNLMQLNDFVLKVTEKTKKNYNNNNNNKRPSLTTRKKNKRSRSENARAVN